MAPEDAQIAQQQVKVSNVTGALAQLSTSRALLAQLQVEEEKLAKLESERAIAASRRPTAIPLPTAIARFVEELAVAMESDSAKGWSLLRQALAPFKLVPVPGAAYELRGALNLAERLVCEKVGSGGVI